MLHIKAIYPTKRQTEIMRSCCVDPDFCPKCGGEIGDGKALQNTYVASGDLGGVCTMNHGGPGKMIECRKCRDCGWSVM